MMTEHIDNDHVLRWWTPGVRVLVNIGLRRALGVQTDHGYHSFSSYPSYSPTRWGVIAEIVTIPDENAFIAARDAYLKEQSRMTEHVYIDQYVMREWTSEVYVNVNIESGRILGVQTCEDYYSLSDPAHHRYLDLARWGIIPEIVTIPDENTFKAARDAYLKEHSKYDDVGNGQTDG